MVTGEVWQVGDSVYVRGVLYDVGGQRPGGAATHRQDRPRPVGRQRAVPRAGWRAAGGRGRGGNAQSHDVVARRLEGLRAGPRGAPPLGPAAGPVSPDGGGTARPRVWRGESRARNHDELGGRARGGMAFVRHGGRGPRRRRPGRSPPRPRAPVARPGALPGGLRRLPGAGARRLARFRCLVRAGRMPEPRSDGAQGSVEPVGLALPDQLRRGGGRLSPRGGELPVGAPGGGGVRPGSTSGRCVRRAASLPRWVRAAARLPAVRRVCLASAGHARVRAVPAGGGVGRAAVPPARRPPRRRLPGTVSCFAA